jgi:hypothetical protein
MLFHSPCHVPTNGFCALAGDTPSIRKAATAAMLRKPLLIFLPITQLVAWLGRSFVGGREIDWIAAVGVGGQRIFIVPTLDLVAVVNAGLYRSRLQDLVPLALLDRYVLAVAEPPR